MSNLYEPTEKTGTEDQEPQQSVPANEDLVYPGDSISQSILPVNKQTSQQPEEPKSQELIDNSYCKSFRSSTSDTQLAKQSTVDVPHPCSREELRFGDTTPTLPPCSTPDYKSTPIKEALYFRNPKPEEHTMSKQLTKYCLNRLPNPESLFSGIDRIEFYQTLDCSLPSHLTIGGLTEIKHAHRNEKKKEFNNKRPRFFKDKNTLYVILVPGRDYIKHYGAIIRFVKCSYEKYKHIPIHLNIDETLEKSAYIHELGELVSGGKNLIIGYVNEVLTDLQKLEQTKTGTKPEVRSREGTFFKMSVVKLSNGEEVYLLGSYYTFWGDLSVKIVKAALERGINKIIYISKLGTLTKKEDIYDQIFSPSSFLLVHNNNDCDNVVIKKGKIKTPISEIYPKLDSCMHASVSTVVEETYPLRLRLENYGVKTIDNEISQIAAIMDDFQEKNPNRSLEFIPLHYATDYLRKPDEPDLELEFDLNSRTDESVFRKAEALDKISQYLYRYLYGKTSQADKTNHDE